tara:strand:+ start:468 stop:1214 length:747 start_codon:yes stop_codon:yes gene_type:complete
MEDFEANPSNHHYLVKDLDNGVLQKYNVMYEPEIGQGIPNEITPTSSEESRFIDEVASWDFIRYQLNEPYRTSLNVTAYDLARYNFLHGDLVQDFKDNSFIGREMQAVIGSLLAVSAKGISVNSGGFTFDVELSDGGLATLQFTGFKNVIGNPEYQVLKVTDADGNEVPLEKLENARIAFRFKSTSNFLLWWSYMTDVYKMKDSEIKQDYWERIRRKNTEIIITDIKDGVAPTPPPPPEPDDDEYEEQ